MGVEQEYFDWLYDKIGNTVWRNETQTYFRLAELLMLTEFQPIVDFDENRAIDGITLRDEFVDEYGSWEGSKLPFEPCSMLEMLIALAVRLHYEMDGFMVGEVPDMFWRMMRNCGLDKFTDEYANYGWNRFEVEVDEILDRINNRTYERNGVGGLFPLMHSRIDVRKQELHAQMGAWCIEHMGL